MTRLLLIDWRSYFCVISLLTACYVDTSRIFMPATLINREKKITFVVRAKKNVQRSELIMNVARAKLYILGDETIGYF